ncbi:hypothetical protein QYM36_014856 [Artemia franciscana]|uniref:Secreted protein n=1 Tax=Artemia franciscana TaxID=6661 RepID=A0AA88HJS8_ARTSF|nr:hypothetical protein QYM36_014856 [Artemia franciscana]
MKTRVFFELVFSFQMLQIASLLCVGPFVQGTQSDNGERLIGLVVDKNLAICNTMFQHKISHLITWHLNDGVTKAQIEYLLVKTTFKSSLLDSCSYLGAKQAPSPVLITPDNH